MFENTYGVVEGGGRPGVLLCTTNTYCVGRGEVKRGEMLCIITMYVV